jgi:hypothetical protein
MVVVVVVLGLVVVTAAASTTSPTPRLLLLLQLLTPVSLVLQPSLCCPARQARARRPRARATPR